VLLLVSVGFDGVAPAFTRRKFPARSSRAGLASAGGGARWAVRGGSHGLFLTKGQLLAAVREKPPSLCLAAFGLVSRARRDAPVAPRQISPRGFGLYLAG